MKGGETEEDKRRRRKRHRWIKMKRNRLTKRLISQTIKKAKVRKTEDAQKRQQTEDERTNPKPNQ